MRFDVFAWSAIDHKDTFVSETGSVHLMCDKEMAVFVSVEGYEVLLGVGKELKRTFQAKGVVRIEAPKTASVYLYEPAKKVVDKRREVFTNIDRKPNESGSVDEVRKLLRKMQVDEWIKRENHKASAAKRKALEAARAEPVDVGDDDEEQVDLVDQVEEGANDEQLASD